MKHYKILNISTNGGLYFKCNYFSRSRVFLFTKKDRNNFEISVKNKGILKKNQDLFSYHKKKYTF